MNLQIVLLVFSAFAVNCQNPNLVSYSVRTKSLDRNANNLYNYVNNVIFNNREANYIQLDSNVSVLHRAIFAVTADTLHLLASGKGIQFIEPGAFDGQRFSGQLQLSNNQLTALYGGSFTNVGVTEIDLSDNQIANVEPGAFENLPNLKVLRLNGNGLRELNPNSVVNSPNIYYLSLGFNNIQRVGENDLSFLKPNSRVVLELNNNEIESVHPAAFSNVYQFDTLNLTQNNLQFLSGDLFKKPKFQFVYLKNNQLFALPQEFFQLGYVARVDLNGNSFTCPTIKSLREFKAAVSQSVYFDEKWYCT